MYSISLPSQLCPSPTPSKAPDTAVDSIPDLSVLRLVLPYIWAFLGDNVWTLLLCFFLGPIISTRLGMAVLVDPFVHEWWPETHQWAACIGKTLDSHPDPMRNQENLALALGSLNDAEHMVKTFKHKLKYSSYVDRILHCFSYRHEMLQIAWVCQRVDRKSRKRLLTLDGMAQKLLQTDVLGDASETNDKNVPRETEQHPAGDDTPNHQLLAAEEGQSRDGGIRDSHPQNSRNLNTPEMP